MINYKRVSVWLSPESVASLDEWAATGLYGLTRTAVATDLLLGAIRAEIVRWRKPAPRARRRR